MSFSPAKSAIVRATLITLKWLRALSASRLEAFKSRAFASQDNGANFLMSLLLNDAL
jgi:hypothetical protein